MGNRREEAMALYLLWRINRNCWGGTLSLLPVSAKIRRLTNCRTMMARLMGESTHLLSFTDHDSPIQPVEPY